MLYQIYQFTVIKPFKVGAHSLFCPLLYVFCPHELLYKNFHPLKYLCSATQHLLSFECPILSVKYAPMAYLFFRTKTY